MAHILKVTVCFVRCVITTYYSRALKPLIPTTGIALEPSEARVISRHKFLVSFFVFR